MNNKSIRKSIISLLGLTVGTFLLAVALGLFQEPNMIAPGGVTGFAIVFKKITNIPIYITNLAINIPLFIIGILVLGKNFGWKTLYATVLLSVFLKIIPEQALTDDLLLASIFGGVLAGIGLGIVFKSGGTTGGTDLAGSILNKLFPAFSTASFMGAIDILVVIFAGVVDQKIETSLYSIISLYLSVKIIDIIQEGFGYAKAFIIISNKSEEIGNRLIKDFGRGVTLFKAKGMYTMEDKDVILCAVNRYQISKVKDMIYDMDKNAFVMVTDVAEVLGEGFKEIEK
ncbi:MAG: YitT family protein [Tissierellia bacterium]|nr:YitT family protein [Tissierellia bacterium]